MAVRPRVGRVTGWRRRREDGGRGAGNTAKLSKRASHGNARDVHVEGGGGAHGERARTKVSRARTTSLMSPSSSTVNSRSTHESSDGWADGGYGGGREQGRLHERVT